MKPLTIATAVVISLLAPRCAQNALPVATTEPPAGLAATLVPSTPTVRPAPPYTDGKSEVPPGHFLFVQFSTIADGKSVSGNFCPGAGIGDFPNYRYDGHSLSGSLEGEVGDSTLGFFGSVISATGAMGGGGSMLLYPMQALPYSDNHGIVIHSIDPGGAAVIEIRGNSYLLEPGQSWVQLQESDPTADCHVTVRYALTNYGLLDAGQLRFRP